MAGGSFPRGTDDADNADDADGLPPPGGTGSLAAKPRPRPGALARSGHLEYDRVLFFSDAIFAIAITLLVIDIRVPGISNPARQLSAAVPNITSFGISFVVIGLFWMGHHSLFRYITVLDRPVIAINLLFLGTIAFLPYPTALLEGGSGSGTAATIFYAACIAGTGLAEFAVWLYSSMIKDLVAPGTSAAVRRYVGLRLLRIPAVFLVSIPIALVSPVLATYFWILVAVAGIALDRFARPAETDAEAEPVTLGRIPGAADRRNSADQTRRRRYRPGAGHSQADRCARACQSACSAVPPG
ncbi:MAG TPA: TMEM175 family protein [Streptosporangiaceae bacterium]|nr:TMEM175 family protein [Streptosporangiaceae bacterium]